VPGGQVRKRLCKTKCGDEREDGRTRGDAEFLLGEERQNCSFQPDHRANEGVDKDEPRELLPVLSKAQDEGSGMRH
jgi:hypothetical protein